MGVAIKPEFLERIQTAVYMWFTTVRADGMPQPTPVWFVWEDGTFLIYTGAQAQKYRNILEHPQVILRIFLCLTCFLLDNGGIIWYKALFFNSQ